MIRAIGFIIILGFIGLGILTYSINRGYKKLVEKLKQELEETRKKNFELLQENKSLEDDLFTAHKELMRR